MANKDSVTTTDGKKAYPANSDKFNADAKKKVDEDQANRKDEDKPVVQMFYTEDGTPVNPATIPPKHTIGEPDPDARPDVHSRVIPADQIDKRNESDLE